MGSKLETRIARLEAVKALQENGGYGEITDAARARALVHVLHTSEYDLGLTADKSQSFEQRVERVLSAASRGGLDTRRHDVLKFVWKTFNRKDAEQ